MLCMVAISPMYFLLGYEEKKVSFPSMPHPPADSLTLSPQMLSDFMAALWALWLSSSLLK